MRKIFCIFAAKLVEDMAKCKDLQESKFYILPLRTQRKRKGR